MVQGKVEICGVNTAKLPLLKAADKDALFAKIREGVPQAYCLRPVLRGWENR